MSKQKLLLIAYRAIGDWIYTSAVIPYLTEKYDVYLEINTKGFFLFHDDPRFKEIIWWKGFEAVKPDDRAVEFAKRWQGLRERIKPDVEINLNGSLEVECIAEHFQDEFWLPVGERRAIFGQHGFYDAIVRRCGMSITDIKALNGLYWSPEQTEVVKKWREKHKENFVVILPIAGSTAQKVLHNFKEITLAILNKYEDAIVYLAGDETCRQLVFDHPRVKTMIGEDVAIKQAAHMAGYADIVIGPETFLLAAAGMWGTPKIIHATTSSVWQMAQFQANDFSIQAPIHCSPCHRAIYFQDSCENPLYEAGKWAATACSKLFRVEDVMERVDHVYKNLRYSQRKAATWQS